jgi:hypothetical protein
MKRLRISLELLGPFDATRVLVHGRLEVGRRVVDARLPVDWDLFKALARAIYNRHEAVLATLQASETSPAVLADVAARIAAAQAGRVEAELDNEAMPPEGP